jgi:4-amino-4-deoxy-L-arabinose transferase-like glycosyltransferase
MGVLPARRFAPRLGLIALLGFLVRVGYAQFFRRDHLPIGGDSYTYSRGAELLVDGYGFIEPLVFEATGTAEQAATHPPLYLLWLAVASFVEPGGTSQFAHILWSCVLGTGTIVLCGLVGRRLGGDRCGLLAAAGAALYPNVWMYDAMLLSETMSTFMVAAVLLLAYRFWDRPGLARAVWLGGACGLAALSRPELVLSLPLVAAPLILFARGSGRGERLRWLVAAGAPAALVIGVWVGFNFTRFEEPVYLTHGYGFQLIAANCDATYSGEYIGYWNGQCANDVVGRVVRPDMDASEREVAVRREVTEYVRANLDRLPAVVAARWGRITGLYRPSQQITLDEYFYERERWVAEGGLVSYYVLAGLSIAGVVVLRRRRVPVLPLLAFPVMVLVAVALAYAETRYRSSAEVVLVLLAAVAVDAAVSRARRRSAPAP